MFPGIIGFIATSFLAAMTKDATQLIVIRVLQAVSAGAIMVIIPAIIRDVFPKEQAAKVLSSILLIMTMGSLIAPLLGGQMLKYLDWRSLFIFLAVIGILSLLLALTRIKETLTDENRLVIPLTQLATNYLTVIRNREAMGSILSYAFFFGGMFAFVTASPFVYMELFNVSPEKYGFLYGANILAMAIANIINIRLIGNFPLFSVFRSGSVLGAVAAFAGLFNVWFDLGGLAGIMIPTVVYIGCMGLVGPNSNALALAHFPKSAGTANALAGTLRFTFGGIAAGLVGLLHDGTAMPMAIVMALCGCLSMLSLLLFKSTKTTSALHV